MPLTCSLSLSPSFPSLGKCSSVTPSRFPSVLHFCYTVRNQEQFSLSFRLPHFIIASAMKRLIEDSRDAVFPVRTVTRASGIRKHIIISQQEGNRQSRIQSRRLKTDEEIHFEALEHYRPNYDVNGETAGSFTLHNPKKNGEEVPDLRFSVHDQNKVPLGGNNLGATADDATKMMQYSIGSPQKCDKSSGDEASLRLNLHGALLSEVDCPQLVPLQEEENLNQNMDLLSSNECMDQKIKVRLESAAAIARQNMCKCEQNVMYSQEQGLSFPKFESLLVEDSWMTVLSGEFQKPYMERLYDFVNQEAAGNIPIYPPPAKLFNAFNSCPFDKVKVVIIGQDPYHGPGQAMGLCFSVERGMKLPSSLANIFTEIQSDLGCGFPSHGNLEKWAYQGVLLLNAVLTVRDHHANSHAKMGWELFTDAAIRALAMHRSGLVFLLWGNSAQQKLRLINRTSHHILMASHPSGMSARKGFFKCRHFSKTNQILIDQGLLPIDWQL